MISKHHLALVAAALSLPQVVLAQTMRCGEALIVPGDTMVAVLEACGEPILGQRLSGELGTRRDQWIYRPGYGQFSYLLTFEGVELRRIEVLIDE